MRNRLRWSIRCVGIIALSSSTACVEAGDRTIPIIHVDSEGAQRLSEGGAFGSIDQIAVRADGMIAVLDRTTGAVGIVNARAPGTARMLRRGQGPGEIRIAVGAGWMPDGRLAVLDTGNGRMSFFDVSSDEIVPGSAVPQSGNPATCA